MKQYLEHALKILTDDYSGYKPNRTFVDTISRFGHQSEYDLSKGFPLLTTKKVHTQAITYELLWFLRGETNTSYLKDKNVRIWDEWADDNGNLGPIYGYQWRHWESFVEDKTSPSTHPTTYKKTHIDQIAQTVKLLREKPDSRRMIISAWNVADVDKMSLPPCHLLFQFNVQGERLDCQLYQRSCDMFLGVPFNTASYAMFTQLMAQETGFKPGLFVHTFGDAHFYCGAGARGAWYKDNLKELKERVKAVNSRPEYLEIKEWIEKNAPSESVNSEGSDHVPKILLQLSREPKQLPVLEIAKKPLLEQIIHEDIDDNFKLINYEPHPLIKAKVAV